MPKKLLMISYYYPPLADVGSLRACSFSKYLPEFGWEPHVISVKNPDRHWCILGTEKPPPGTKVYYTYSLFSNLTHITGKLNGLLGRLSGIFGIELKKPLVRDLLCIPDQLIGWIPATVLKGYGLIKQENIDAIYVSCKPFSSAIIGAILKFLTKRPLVLDFRDPVSPLVPIFNKGAYQYLPSFLITKKIEEIILKYADRLILVTKETEKLYLSTFPFLRGKTEVIYNGFEGEYFNINPTPFQKFTMVYVGNFYSGMVPAEPLFAALAKIANEPSSPGEKICFMCIGTDARYINDVAKKYNISTIITVMDRVSRAKSVEYIHRASLMLIRSVPPMMTTKLFESLAAGAPILAVTDSSEAGELIRAYSPASYYIVKPDDVDGIAEAMKDAYEKWRNGELRNKKNPKFYSGFNKRNLTAKLARLLDAMLFIN